MEKYISDDKAIKAKFYVNEKNVFNKNDSICSFFFNSNEKSVYKDNVILGLEISKYVGPRYLYGYVNILFEHTTGFNVYVEIPYTKANVEHFPNSILDNREYCYKGIPEEFVDDLKNSIVKYIENSKNFPACKIKIIDAANCEVGSCSAYYEIIIHKVLDLFIRGKYDQLLQMKDEELLDFIRMRSDKK